MDPERLPNSSARFMAMAVSLTGSPEKVRAAMECPKEQFRQYREGAKQPTWDELCRLIVLVLGAQKKRRFRPNGVPMDDPVRYALGRGFAIAGGIGPLANQLEVPVPDLVQWLDGANKPPREVLAKVGEMLVEEVGRQRSDL